MKAFSLFEGDFHCLSLPLIFPSLQRQKPGLSNGESACSQKSSSSPRNRSWNFSPQWLACLPSGAPIPLMDKIFASGAFKLQDRVSSEAGTDRVSPLKKSPSLNSALNPSARILRMYALFCIRFKHLGWCDASGSRITAIIPTVAQSRAEKSGSVLES